MARNKMFKEKSRKYVKLLIAMQLQLKFGIILTDKKEPKDNKRNFRFSVTVAILNNNKSECVTDFKLKGNHPKNKFGLFGFSGIRDDFNVRTSLQWTLDIK